MDDGQIDWSDLTAAAPNGIGTDLAPDASLVVTVTFTAREDTGSLSNGETLNTATLHDSYADPDGPSGPMDAVGPLAEKDASDGVSINRPTGVFVTDLDVSVEDDAVTLSWRTVSEVNILGFNILRSSGREPLTPVNDALIPALYSGMEAGADYMHLDDGVAPGRYTYVLEAITTNGVSARFYLGKALIRRFDRSY